MEVKKAHCFFEQSGTFKNEFIKLGIPAEDYDIQNNFGETDHVIDLFKEIDDAYYGNPSIFDNIKQDELIVAFYPCIYFCEKSMQRSISQTTTTDAWILNRRFPKSSNVRLVGTISTEGSSDSLRLSQGSISVWSLRILGLSHTSSRTTF